MPPEDLNLDEEGKGGKGKLIIMIVAALILVAGSIGGTLFFSGALDKKDEEQVRLLSELNPTYYVKFEPEFIVNFAGDQDASYMQVELELMTRDQYFVDEITKQMPAIRHQILLILSNQKFLELKTKEGKNKLRQDILNKVQEMIPGNPKVPAVEAVYFTMFVMQ